MPVMSVFMTRRWPSLTSPRWRHSVYSTLPLGSSAGETRCETLRGPSVSMLPSMLMVPTWAVV